METTTRKAPRKKAAAKKTEEATSTQTSSQVAIAVDFPQEGDTIWPGHYAFRLSGTPDAEVEISVNGGDWQHCRFAVGFYWHDWWVENSGKYEINARLRVNGGPWQKAKTRTFKSASPTAN